nr:MAG: hypothetical protein [Helarchaeota virus Nidhogg Meg22_1012]URC17444.1 MAG: hypothetical protein [Helarchaeota virus Nidhogg Meg22_1214]
MYYYNTIDKIFRYCEKRDVEKGGNYDVRLSAILFWSHPWNTPENIAKSEYLGHVIIKNKTQAYVLDALKYEYDPIQVAKIWHMLVNIVQGISKRDDSLFEKLEPIPCDSVEDLHKRSCVVCGKKSAYDRREKKYFCFYCNEYVEVL